MRLTVGPLPAAVYWRRRAVVLTAIVLVLMVIFYSCSGPAGKATTGAAATPTPSAEAVEPTASEAVLVPTVEAPATTSPAPSPSAFTLPTGGGGATVAAQGGACTDTEMVVTATPASGKAAAGATIDFTIKFRNNSQRSCTRDIGADAQELRLMDGQKVIWSSDDCSPRHGSDVRKFAPDDAVAFTLTWNGKRSRSGTGEKVCTAGATAPAIGAYQLVGRLGTAYSSPTALRLT
ncbi:hypothetical protein GCM10009682_48320 [Luedemannella flava]|uniref:DUF4232 domain-containing protein n=1 Tax=Luedemannella flava TaxID=349316 RepID=A0ABN2MEV6_9ACTN